MAYLDISSTSASILRSTDGADDPDQLVAVAAGELFEWAWLIGELGGWLADANEHTRADFARCFGGYRTLDQTAWFATHIAERIAALLDGDRGQP
jgi:hypothetical protein